jgi:hypothetical protein
MLILGAGCDVQALITLSGANCSLICQNGVDIDGISATGNFYLIDGGGWETLVDGGTTRIAIDLTGTDGLIKDIACQTTAGQGNAFYGLSWTGANTRIVRVRVVDADDRSITGSGADNLIEGCEVLGSDDRGIFCSGPRTRIVGNYIIATGGDGIQMGGNGDDSTIIGNVVKDATGDSIGITANAENCVVVGNRLDGAVNDASGTSTVASNDTTAF